MKYIDMVRNAPNKTDGVMWESISAVSEMVDKMFISHPDMAKRFMMQEYGRLYGRHFNEELAKAVVADMYHYVDNNELIKGEIESCEDVMGMISGIDGIQDKRWDAYVGVNAFLHDFAKCGLSLRQLVDMALTFWFKDDDFDENDSKVFWYFASR